MNRYLLKIAFDGSAFCGWQRQKEDKEPTVEGAIEQVLSALYGFEVDIIGQGRTDTGVHATAQYAHVDLPDNFAPDKLGKILNAKLPQSIAIKAIQSVGADFHARFDATYRAYEYGIALSSDPRLRSILHPPLNRVDWEMLQDHVQIFLGEHDFGSFAIGADTYPHTRCTVLEIGFRVGWDAQAMVFHVKANRFLRRMVRRIVGTLMKVGLGQLAFEQMQDLLLNPQMNSPKVYTAKAYPLSLSEVGYPTTLSV